MQIRDQVYGQIEISEPIILALINSHALRRLKGISQAGYFEPHYPGTDQTRFEHSVGVYWLLKKYRTPLQEQIAGLIHDISHSAFSHCIDYVLDAGSQTKHDHQDNIFSNFVEKSEIPDILRKFRIDLKYILNDEYFPLKEKLLPDLCADRIDYSLRTAVAHGELDTTEVQYFLKSLLAEAGNWVFRDFASAKKYAELFQKLNQKYYAGLSSAVMFSTVGDYLRHGLQKGYMSENDLYATDAAVLSKLDNYLEKDKKLKLLFERMSNKVGFHEDPENYDARVFVKSRAVDPLCKHGSGTERLSKINPNWGKIVARELKPKEYLIKFDR